jgi:hypothetical protein
MAKEAVTKPKVGVTTIALLIIFLIIPLIFFYLLKSNTGADFSFKEIAWSIAISIVVTAFLIWDKSVIKNRPYLGLIIGIVVLATTSYGITYRFKGPTTTTFLIISAIIILFYLGKFFFRYKNRDFADKSGASDFNDKV